MQRCERRVCGSAGVSLRHKFGEIEHPLKGYRNSDRHLDKGENVAMSKADKAHEYMRYAEHCLETAGILPKQEARMLHREMAGEWIKLAQEMVNDAAFGALAPGQRRKSSLG
jgi:hypothetical protein